MGHWEQIGEDRLRIDTRSRWVRLRDAAVAFGPGVLLMIAVFAVTLWARG